VGNLNTRGKVFIGQTGKITGEIKCKNCEVEGVIDGKITVEELLSLRSMAKLYGEIRTGKLAIEPGAIFTGKCDMGGKKEISTEQPAPKPKEGQH
jgi:cytoskeletal protein CcmA (bactofilin family)